MTDQTTYNLSSDEGFSLSELLVAVSLTVIIIGAAYMAMAAVNVMTDSIFAHEQASRAGTIAIERIASDVREGWSPTKISGIPFRTRTATMAEFYLNPDIADTRQLVKYYMTADASGTYTLYRAIAATTSAISAADVTSATPFTYSAASVVSKGLTTPSIFSYFRQAPGLPSATATGPPSSVQIRVITKAIVGKTTAIATMTTLAQMRTMYDYTSP